MLCLEEKLNICAKNFDNFQKKDIIENIIENYLFSIKKFDIFKENFKDFLIEDQNKFSIIIVGSYGRLESSPLSDIDCCIIHKDDNEKSDERINIYIDEIKKQIESKFKEILKIKVSILLNTKLNNILKNIGGPEDTSMNFTTRVLIMLESIPLINDELYTNVFNELCENYLEEYINEKKYPLFLTNEIIRFWRTLCIDYRWKKKEVEKPWGLRNIKLRFSRKLLCFSSIVLLIMLYKSLISFEEFKKYISCPSSMKLILIYKIILNNGLIKNRDKLLKFLEEILIRYDKFLKNINQEKIRESLEKILFEKRTQNENYNILKKEAHEFHSNLISFMENFDNDILKKYLIF